MNIRIYIIGIFLAATFGWSQPIQLKFLPDTFNLVYFEPLSSGDFLVSDGTTLYAATSELDQFTPLLSAPANSWLEIIKTNNSDIWVAGNNFLARFQNQTWTIFPAQGLRISEMEIDINGKVWCIANDTLYSFENNNFHNYSVRVSSLKKKRKLHLWTNFFNLQHSVFL
jgi:hypothetical protein